MSVLKITSENYDSEVLKSKDLVLVDFYADWCGPCRMMGPVIEQIADEMQGVIKVGKVNVDENQDLAEKYSVETIPTILLIKDGEIDSTFVGVTDKTEIENEINKFKDNV